MIRPLQGQTFKIDTIQFKGATSEMVNIVILGDGYTAAQMSTFVSNSTSFTTVFFNETPMKEYINYFNVFAIETPSTQTGAKHPGTASDCGGTVPVSNPTNYFGSSFDTGGIHRLLYPKNTSTVQSVLASTIPSYDLVFVLVNSPYYGGGGGSYAAFSMEASSNEIGKHEMGYSFGTLADEYWAGTQYAGEKANMTSQSSPTLVKWKNWVGINNVGVYAHSGSGASGWYKPHQNCKMQYLGKTFCNVCVETLIEKVHGIVNPIDSYSPSSSTVAISNNSLNFSLKLYKPNPNTLRTNWTLDGAAKNKNVDSVIINGTSLSNGSHQLVVTVLDTTYLTKNAQHPTSHLYTVTWNINKTSTGIDITDKTNASAITIFPNPFTENLALKTEIDEPTDISIIITDITGKTMKKINYGMLDAGTHEMDISKKVQHLSNGEYVISIYYNNQMVISKKIIKQS